MFLEAAKALWGAHYNRCSVITHIREILILIAGWLHTLRTMPALHSRPCAGPLLLFAGPRSRWQLLVSLCCRGIAGTIFSFRKLTSKHKYSIAQWAYAHSPSFFFSQQHPCMKPCCCCTKNEVMFKFGELMVRLKDLECIHRTGKLLNVVISCHVWWCQRNPNCIVSR